MLHARGQSTEELQQQHVDRLNRHTIHTTSAGMAHANGPTARATVNSTSWWWGQEQRVVLNFLDADTTQKAIGATSAQINFVCVICASNSYCCCCCLSFSPSVSVCVFVQGHLTTISPFIYLPFYFFAATTKCLYKRHLLPTSLLASIIFRCDHGPDSLHAVICDKLTFCTGGCSEGLGAFSFFFNNNSTTVTTNNIRSEVGYCPPARRKHRRLTI